MSKKNNPRREKKKPPNYMQEKFNFMFMKRGQTKNIPQTKKKKEELSKEMKNIEKKIVNEKSCCTVG